MTIRNLLRLLVAAFLLTLNAGCVATGALVLYVAEPGLKTVGPLELTEAWVGEETVVVSYRKAVEQGDATEGTAPSSPDEPQLFWGEFPLESGSMASGTRQESDASPARWESRRPVRAYEKQLATGSPPPSALDGKTPVRVLRVAERGELVPATIEANNAAHARRQDLVAWAAAREGVVVYEPGLDDAIRSTMPGNVSFGVARYDAAEGIARRDDFLLLRGLRNPREPLLLLLPVTLLVDIPIAIVAAPFYFAFGLIATAGD